MIKNLILFLLFLSFSLQGQERKNTITIFYTPIITNGTLYTQESSWVSPGFYQTQPPSRFFYGYQIGIDYSRQIKKNIVSISYRFASRGQQSPHYFNTAFANPEDSPENYGGGMWDTRLTSNEFILGVERPFYKNASKGLTIGIKGAMSIDIYNNFIIRDYIIEKDTGIKRPGCCTRGSSLNPDEWFNQLKDKLSGGHFRLGFMVMLPVRLMLVSDVVSFSIAPEIEYLTKIIEEININTGNGHLFSAGVRLGIGVSF